MTCCSKSDFSLQTSAKLTTNTITSCWYCRKQKCRHIWQVADITGDMMGIGTGDMMGVTTGGMMSVTTHGMMEF